MESVSRIQKVQVIFVHSNAEEGAEIGPPGKEFTPSTII